MLAKLTSKNQLTIPKAALNRLPKTAYFAVEVRNRMLLLQPVEVRPLGTKEQHAPVLPAQVQQVLDAFVARVRAAYGERLVHVILYGSYARGEATKHSDVDVLVVLRDMPEEQRSQEVSRLSSLAYQVTYGAGIPLLLSVMPADYRAYHSGATSFLRGVKDDSVILV